MKNCACVVGHLRDDSGYRPGAVQGWAAGVALAGRPIRADRLAVRALELEAEDRSRGDAEVQRRCRITQRHDLRDGAATERETLVA